MNGLVLNVCATVMLLVGIFAYQTSFVAGSAVLYSMSIAIILGKK